MSQLFHDAGMEGARRVMLATTAYDAPDASYTFAMARSREVLHKAGIATEYVLLQGNCHVDDARNTVLQEFLLSDCQDIVFIDADVTWKPDALLTLCQYDKDVVGGIYPFRRNDAPSRGNMPIRMIEGVHEADENGLCEVEGLPAGFMKISRNAIQILAKGADHYKNKTDTRSLVPILFERSFENGNRWGGDLNFCRKWRAKGGKVYAVYEMRLGHVAKGIIWDSLGAGIRRQTKTCLKYMADQIRDGNADPDLMGEARRYVGNEDYGALEDVLMLCATVKADGPILEAGSGLSTIVLAAANPDHRVWCLEHDPFWARQIMRMAREAGTSNIAICEQPINNGWYDLSDLNGELPEKFSVGLNDGPPRTLGSRMGFFERFGSSVDTIICDDADDPDYRNILEYWSAEHGRNIKYVVERGAIIA